MVVVSVTAYNELNLNLRIETLDTLAFEITSGMKGQSIGLSCGHRLCAMQPFYPSVFVGYAFPDLSPTTVDVCVTTYPNIRGGQTDRGVENMGT